MLSMMLHYVTRQNCCFSRFYRYVQDMLLWKGQDLSCMDLAHDEPKGITFSINAVCRDESIHEADKEGP